MSPAPSTRSPPPRRRHPRAEVHVPVRLSLARDRRRTFEATLPTANISVGGLFLESTFFLKLGMELDVSLELPAPGAKDQRLPVSARGVVVRVESADARGSTRSGFAIKFTECDEASRVALASYFLGPVVRQFIDEYARSRKLKPNKELVGQMVDLLAAWELRRSELPEGSPLARR